MEQRYTFEPVAHAIGKIVARTGIDKILISCVSMVLLNSIVNNFDLKYFCRLFEKSILHDRQLFFTKGALIRIPL
jgi:hypothetical protein